MSELTYYPQRYQTDCLIAATESLLQLPREEFEVFLTYIEEGGKKYMAYAALANILRAFSFRGAWVPSGEDWHWSSTPAIWGLSFGKDVFHACFWDGNRLWCGQNKVFMQGRIKVAYVIQEHMDIQPAQDPDIVLNYWHKVCSGEIVERPKTYLYPLWEIDLP